MQLLLLYMQKLVKSYFKGNMKFQNAFKTTHLQLTALYTIVQDRIF